MVKRLQSWGPLAGILAGFYSVYANKAGGFQQVFTDLEGLTWSKISSKTTNIVIAVVAGIAASFLLKSKMDPWVKLVVGFILFYVISYDIFKVIDPVNGTTGIRSAASRTISVTPGQLAGSALPGTITVTGTGITGAGITRNPLALA